MLHVLDFEGNIIDFISKNDKALIDVKHERNIKDYTEILDITMLASRAVKFKERNRVIFLDSRNEPREFIINRIEQDSTSKYSLIECNASYLEDIATGVPYPPQKFEKLTTTQALSDVLKDTGWKVSEDTEYNGTRTTSWTSYQSRFDVLKQLTTTYKMVIDFHIDLDSRKVKSRYVSLKEPKPLFKGKEIVRGKDLLGLKRTVDVSEVRTALVCLGPEKENGERIKLIVQDDEAQKQFGLPTRYIWDVYEPESEDENMTEQRLRTLGTTQLNKVKSAAVSYEVTSLDIKKAYPHEIIRLGDIVRVKDRDFTPALYVEGEVISETYNPLTNVSVYSFGNYVEYKESDLRAEFTKKLDAIRQKLNDGLTNVNTIVADVVEGKLEYFERKIIKGVEPPENPVNDMLWLDTSNPDVAVLRRYWEGQWINATAEKAEDIGAITREKALYSELTNTFVNLSIQHSKLLNEMHEVMNSEYLVDFDLKDELNAKLDATVSIYNNIKSNLESMTDETATIGKLIDTQTLFLNYRTAMQNLYNVVERAKVAIDERFKLLQSQYTDEKFNEAMKRVAETFGIKQDENGGFIGPPETIAEMVDALRTETKEEMSTLLKRAEYQTDKEGIVERLNAADSKRIQLSNEIKDRVTITEYNAGMEEKTNEINNLNIGSENLLLNSKKRSDGNNNSIFSFIAYSLTQPLKVGKAYTFACDFVTNDDRQSGKTSVYPYRPANKLTTVDIVDGKINYTFIAQAESTQFLIYKDVAGQSDVDLEVIIEKAILVEGDKVTGWSPANEDIKEDIQQAETNAKAYSDGLKQQTDQTLTTYDTRITQNGQEISQRATKEEFNASRKTLSQVISELTNSTMNGLTYTYDENGAIQSFNIGPQGVKIKGDKVDIKLNKEFNLLVGDVSKKADETNIINKINLSREGLDINVNNIGIRGGDSKDYVKIKNDVIELAGTYTRTWDNQTYTQNVYTRFKNGYMRFRNNALDRSLYFSDFGVSTYVDGDSTEASGTLQFFDTEYSTARGVTLNSANGVVALKSNTNRVMLDANATVNIESETSSVYIRPMRNSRIGRNEFRMWVKDNDTASDTDGVLTYGSLTSGSTYGSGIRFDKSSKTNIVYATNNNGDIGSGDFYARRVYGDFQSRSGYLYLMANDRVRITDYKGYNDGEPNYADLQCQHIQANTIRTNVGRDFYIGVSDNELRVTNNLFWNGGNTSYKPVRASAFNNASLEQYKTDIKKWDYDALTVIVNDLELYQFKYKNEEGQEKGLNHRGVVIGRDYKTPSEFIFGDGVNLYEMITWSLRAIQQLNEKMEALQNERTS
ncbi:phage tail spike protein [Staphylococcus chromogenes]|uniref:phage tail spike protein n=1 Tax=Staphylococcus chromogenes TaxID=46126 RepID=UPI0029027981|nr:phage tail spike protein [Staphylococcus chromogenes]MDU0476359.1 phage tail spike protein [Staphylococcus chromogenes]